ncbi:hypothetical protein, partial [Methylicorpusculum sp.]|uniref:hypothetical protein n=1 Tax=Methylicorpusculum sp. TaxID=2713644 RepID=UPI002ABC1FDE
SCAFIVIQLQMHKIALYLYVQLEQDSNAQFWNPKAPKIGGIQKTTPVFPGILIITIFLKNFVQISECRYR